MPRSAQSIPDERQTEKQIPSFEMRAKPEPHPTELNRPIPEIGNPENTVSIGGQ